MANIPASLGEAMHAETAFLETSTSAAAGDQFAQLDNWNFRGSHTEAVSQYGTGEQYDHGRGGLLFVFSLFASKGAIDDLAAKYNISATAGSRLATYHWRLKYYTLSTSTAAQYLNFEGRVRDLNIDRAPGSAGTVKVSGTIRLCDDNGVFSGAFPVTATARA